MSFVSPLLDRVHQSKVLTLLFYTASVLIAWYIAGFVAHQTIPNIGLDFVVMEMGLEVDHQWCRVIAFMIAATTTHGLYALGMRAAGVKRGSIAFIVGITIVMTLFSDQIDFSMMAEQEGLSKTMFYSVLAIGVGMNFVEHIVYVIGKVKAVH